jgi:hypothetical protein
MSGYNGWTNWDTWHVSLCFGDALLEIANDNGEDMEPDTAEELVSEWIGTAGNDYAQWLVNNHLAEVNWREIVKHTNDDRDKEEEEAE